MLSPSTGISGDREVGGCAPEALFGRRVRAGRGGRAAPWLPTVPTLGDVLHGRARLLHGWVQGTRMGSHQGAEHLRSAPRRRAPPGRRLLALRHRPWDGPASPPVQAVAVAAGAAPQPQPQLQPQLLGVVSGPAPPLPRVLPHRKLSPHEELAAATAEAAAWAAVEAASEAGRQRVSDFRPQRTAARVNRREGPMAQAVAAASEPAEPARPAAPVRPACPTSQRPAAQPAAARALR